jgi:primosomal protein N' (replication factor Y)
VARTEERAGWPLVDIVDQGDEVPWRRSLISAHLTDLLRSGRRVVCVHNVPGRNRLVACRSCAALWRCERCDAALGQPARDTLRCARCGTERPVVCQACGATAPVDLRPGVERLHDDLAALTGKPVVVVAGPPTDDPVPDADVYVGTEAVLHRVRAADVVAFLDLDAELLAPRYRAGEQVLALLVRAARLVGGRDGGGRLVVQTSLPRHDVLAAVLLADPGRYAAAELRRRRELGFPPVGALASVGGEGAAAFVAALGTLTRLRVLGPHDGRYLVQAPTWKALADGLAAVPRPAARVRVEVDPPRV